MHNEFPIDSDIIYLNHAAVAPWPKRTSDAITAFAQQNLHQGATHYPDWTRCENELRDHMAWLINAESSDEIAILKNTSEALSTVAYGLDWQPGDNIVSFAQEFPSNRVVWQSLASKGVETRLIDLAATSNPEQALLAACDERTRLLSTSSVQYANGLRIDLDPIGRFCRDNGILYCVDAIQSLGALPFDVQQCQADFVMADGHKWMLGPEGVALFYVRAEVRERLSLNQYGWHMLADTGNYSSGDWAVSPTGTRFECGSPNMLGIHGLHASLGLIRELGIDTVAERLLDNSSYLLQLIMDQPRLRLLTSPEPARRSGIVTFSIPGRDSQDLYRTLMREGLICANRGGGIRLSPHFYNSHQQLDQAIDKVLAAVA